MNINQQSNMWNERYALHEYVYGKEPNVFFKDKIKGMTIGKGLFPAEGEGRNAVFAASIGWEVTAFDLSIEGQKKALKLSEEMGVIIDYKVGNYTEHGFKPNSFDLIVFVFAHFAGKGKIDIHHDLNQYLKPGGKVIFEAFGKKHLEYQNQYPNIGGPRDVDTLWSKDEVMEAFHDFEFEMLEECETELNEGNYHVGTGSVIRFIGTKN